MRIHALYANLWIPTSLHREEPGKPIRLLVTLFTVAVSSWTNMVCHVLVLS